MDGSPPLAAGAFGRFNPHLRSVTFRYQPTPSCRKYSYFRLFVVVALLLVVPTVVRDQRPYRGSPRPHQPTIATLAPGHRAPKIPIPTKFFFLFSSRLFSSTSLDRDQSPPPPSFLSHPHKAWGTTA